MKFYVDSAEIEDIREAKKLGVADGVTTNPTLIVKSGRQFKEVVEEIAAEIDGPIFTEVIHADEEGILEEGYEMAKWSEQVVVKIPATADGIKAARKLEADGVPTGITLIFSPSQALLAAKAGVSYLIPFVGRLDDVSADGTELVSQIVTIVRNYPELESQIVAASIRHPMHVVDFALMGVDIVTAPVSVYKQLLKHPLTDVGIEKFLSDWQKANK
ncbi:MAG: fructose-6-phosphate aldolase [bacterium]